MNDVLPFVIVNGLLIMFLVLFIIMAGRRLHVPVPPGRVAVRTGWGGAQAFRADGAIVLPLLHRIDFVYADVETLDLDGRQLAVQLGDHSEDVLRAFHAFGQKPVNEMRRLLRTLVSSAKGDERKVEVKLAKVGYRIT